PLHSTLFPYTTLFRSYLDFLKFISQFTTKVFFPLPRRARTTRLSLRLLCVRLNFNINSSLLPDCGSFKLVFVFLTKKYKTQLLRSEEHTSELQSRFDL